MKDLLKKVLQTFSLQITPDFRIHRLFQKNVFKTNHARSALIIYITRPFIMPLGYRHTNLLECYTAGEILNELGYNVDVIDCNIKQKINFEKYDVIYGMGEMMEKSFFSKRKERVCTIFYGTGLNPIVSNTKTTLRMRDFYQRHGKLLWNSSRMIFHPVHAQVLLSNAVISLGDSYNFNDYVSIDLKETKRYYQIPSFFYNSYDIELDTKDFNIAKKNFIWFGSSGAIHKGLDIVIDIFSGMPDMNLHICGVNPNENDFLVHYSTIIANAKNITNHGFLNLQSAEFRKIMEQCGFIIFPSCAEGGSPAVLNCAANGGLVPIISRDCGLDLDGYGWTLETPDLELFKEAVKQANETSEEGLKTKSIRIKEYVRKTYTYEKYRQRLKQILSDILKKHNQ